MTSYQEMVIAGWKKAAENWERRALEAEELARDRKTTLETLGCSVHSTPLPDLDVEGKDLETYAQGRVRKFWVNDRANLWLGNFWEFGWHLPDCKYRVSVPRGICSCGFVEAKGEQ